MGLTVKRIDSMPSCSPWNGPIPNEPNHGWGVYVEPIPESADNQMLVGPTYARECDANIGLVALSKLAVDWNESNPRRLCYKLYAVVKNEEGLYKVMTEHLQW